MKKIVVKLVVVAGLFATVLASGVQASSPALLASCVRSGNMCVSVTCPGTCTNFPTCTHCVD
jgi:hypothetical protein